MKTMTRMRKTTGAILLHTVHSLMLHADVLPDRTPPPCSCPLSSSCWSSSCCRPSCFGSSVLAPSRAPRVCACCSLQALRTPPHQPLCCCAHQLQKMKMMMRRRMMRMRKRKRRTRRTRGLSDRAASACGTGQARPAGSCGAACTRRPRSSHARRGSG